MLLLHGANISAPQIEREIAVWDAMLFARLCNCVAWAMTWHGAQSLPAFTERVYVQDNGIDAEWFGELGGAPAQHEGLLRPGPNVFQYKKREVAEQARGKIVSDLCRELRGAIADVEYRTGKTLGSYVLFTNIDLTTAQHEQIKKTLRAEAGESLAHVGVVGAATIAAMLNDLPHLRSAFFTTAAFRTWEESWRAHTSAWAFVETRLIGRDSVIEQLTGWIADPAVRVIALTGTHMMGKSRVALEATRHWDATFVESLQRPLGIDDLLRLESAGRTVIALINDPGTELAGQLAREALARDRLKLVLCVAMVDEVPTLGFGYDDRLRQLSLPSLTNHESQLLLKAAGARLDYSLESWVVDNAGGVPGVLLAAAHVGANLRTDGDSFLDQVAKEFENQAKHRLQPNEVQALRIAALLLHLGVRGEVASEAQTVCSHFGIEANRVLNALDRLAGSGFVRIDGSYVEVVPPPLANRLAAQMLRGHDKALRDCFTSLAEPARRRLLGRLVQVGSDEVERFWASLLENDGPLSSLEGIIENTELFKFTSAVAGSKVGALLLQHLRGQTVAQRREIRDRARRDIVRAAEEMLFRTEASETGLRCLVLLAEAENESWSNNSAGVAKEAFGPLHPQVPLTLDRRLAVLTDMLRVAPGDTVSVLAVEAIAEMLSFSSATTLRQSSSGSPLGRLPEMTWDDLWQYLAECLLLLDAATTDGREKVRQRAADRLPRSLTNFIARGHSAGMPRLQILVDRVLEDDRLFDVSDLADRMRWCRYALRDSAHGGVQANAELIGQLSVLLERLEGADFPLRLRLWVGGYSVDLDAPVDPGRTGNDAVLSLAQEVYDKPDLLSDEIVDWLLDAQRGNQFWHRVGQSDTEGRLRPRIRTLAARDEGAGSVVSYLAGWCDRDPDQARAFVTDSAANRAMAPRVELTSALEVESPDDGAKRIAQLLRESRISDRDLDALLAGRWAQTVSEDQFVEVLRLLAGNDFETGPQLPELMFYRLHNKELELGPLAEFAWCYLESHPILRRHLGDYYSDQLGSRLAWLNMDRAFALLDRCLRDARSGSRWNPLSSVPSLEFWNTLAGADRSRAVAVLLEAGADDNGRSTVLWHLPGVIDFTRDTPVLLAYASRGEGEALLVCRAITGGREGFWPIAIELINMDVTNQRIRSELEQRILRTGLFVTGSYSVHLQHCLEDVERELRREDMPMRPRAWLNDVVRRLRLGIEQQRRQESDARVNR